MVGNFTGVGFAPQFPGGRVDRYAAVVGGGFDDDRGAVLLEAVVESLPHRVRDLLRLGVGRGLGDIGRHIVDGFAERLQLGDQLIVCRGLRGKD